MTPGARPVLARLRRAPLLRCPRTPSLARGEAAGGSSPIPPGWSRS